MARLPHLPHLPLLLTAALTLACAADDPETDTGDEAGTGDTDTGGLDESFELLDADCPFAVPTGRSADCYTLSLPLDRDDPGGERVELPLAVLHPPAPALRPPVVYLHGGPGGDAYAYAQRWFDEPLSQDGELIVFDMRGSGQSTPKLDCPEVEAAWFAGFTQTLSPQEELAVMAEGVAACRDRLAAETKLDAFDTLAIVDDLEDLRRALDFERWTLYGVSYGTRVALASARRYPESVHALILDSVYPPELGGVAWMEQTAGEAVDKVIAGCLEEASCGAQFPELEANLDDAIASLDAEPYQVAAEDSRGVVHELSLSGADLYAGLYNALYDAEFIPNVPLLIAIAGLGGNFGFLDQIAEEALPLLTRLDEGARLSIDCADAGALIDPAELDAAVAARPELATVYLGHAIPFCALWDVEPLPAEFNEPVISDAPTLILAGEFDPVTPSWHGELVAGSLPDAELFLFPGEGHGPSLSNACAATIVRDFAADGPIDAGCHAALSDTTFP